jgi:hypothetical protein
MPAGEIILVSYGEENITLSEKPQISFFKIVYRRYTNFSIETVQTNFKYETKFGKKYTVEISKIGDLLNKMWLVIELPEIPTVYNLNNNIDKKIKFKWTKKVAYALIDYIEIEIGNQIISRQLGEWMNVLEELNWNNYNSSLDEYIGNTPDLTTYQLLDNNFKSKTLYIPLFFWFCNNSGSSLPLLSLLYNNVRLNIQFNSFETCGIFSPSNYINVEKYYGEGILGEPLVQLTNQGISWGEFDSIDVGNFDPVSMNINSYVLYYRKISDNQFITTSNFQSELIDILTSQNAINYIIYGLYSGSIYVPIKSSEFDAQSIYIQKTYIFNYPQNLIFKKTYLLSNYIYIDRDERKKIFSNKHQYTIEQVYYSNPKILANLNNKIYIESINPCKYFVFMAQVKYFKNNNVNENFNYNLYFFNTNLVNTTLTNQLNLNFENQSVIKSMYFSLNSNQAIENHDMKYFSVLNPFLSFPMAKNYSNFGISSFSLYPNTFQPSGSCNLSYFNSFEINATFNNIDINYNKYFFKLYTVNYNFLIIANGVAATIFNSPL